MTTYRIVRFFQREAQPNVVLRTGLTLDVAQAHCNDPETSSVTAKGYPAQQRAKLYGPWFDGYESEDT